MNDWFFRIQAGNVCMVLCCVSYLAWWAIAFHPEKTFPAPPKYLLFLVTLLSGLAGLYLLGSGLTDAAMETAGTGNLSNFMILGAGVAVYLIALFLTGRLLRRQITTELLLIVLWTVLELCLWNSLRSAARMNGAGVAVFAAVILAVAAVSMYCYLVYFKLEPRKAYYIGMVPLLQCGAVTAVQTVIFQVRIH